jgi:hypothetical protein
VFYGRDCVAGAVTKLWAGQTRCSDSIRKFVFPVYPGRLRRPLSLPFIPRTPKRFNPSCFELKILYAFLLSPVRVLHILLSRTGDLVTATICGVPLIPGCMKSKYVSGYPPSH